MSQNIRISKLNISTHFFSNIVIDFNKYSSPYLKFRVMALNPLLIFRIYGTLTSFCSQRSRVPRTVAYSGSWGVNWPRFFLFLITATSSCTFVQKGGLPYGSQGAGFYLRPWDPLNGEAWIAPIKLTTALSLSDRVSCFRCV